MIPEIKTPFSYWVMALQIAFSLIILFFVDWIVGIATFIFAEVIVNMTQKEMGKRMEIAINKYIQPRIDELEQKLKESKK